MNDLSGRSRDARPQGPGWGAIGLAALALLIMMAASRIASIGADGLRDGLRAWLLSPTAVYAVDAAALALSLAVASAALWAGRRVRYASPAPLAPYLRRGWRGRSRRGTVVGTTPAGPAAVRDGDRTHTLIAGLSGTGKSQWMAGLAAQDIRRGRGGFRWVVLS